LRRPPLNAAQENSHRYFEKHGTHKGTLWAKCRDLSCKSRWYI